MSLLELLQDLLPDSWFNDVRMNFGPELSDDMIVQSVQEASDFFNIENPMLIAEDFTTGVYSNMEMTPMDDILIFNREQLLDMGITEKEGLDLVMTHEGAHRALQGLDLGFDSHQEELCCDFMAGVRAGLNGIDVSQMEDSLADTPVSDSHPGGADRVDSIENGVQFAQDYMERYGHAPSFSECLDFFTGEADLEDLAPAGQIPLRPEHDSVFDAYTDSGESTGSAAFVDNSHDESNTSFRGYTQSEINSRMSKAEHEMRWQESNMRHREYMMKSKARMGEPYEYEEYQFNVAKRKWEEAKAEYNRWKHTKPEIKGFVNDADWHIKEAQRALDRGDMGSYNDHLSSAKICSR